MQISEREIKHEGTEFVYFYWKCEETYRKYINYKMYKLNCYSIGNESTKVDKSGEKNVQKNEDKHTKSQASFAHC